MVGNDFRMVRGFITPQIGLAIRLFVVDASPFDDEDQKLKDFKKVFINPEIVEEKGDKWTFNEGCLSIPKIREDIMRGEAVTMTYYDENFKQFRSTFSGITARVILHEYDHIEGKLFIDYLKPLKRKLLKGKLDDISRGKVSVDYKMVFPK